MSIRIARGLTFLGALACCSVVCGGPAGDRIRVTVDPAEPRQYIQGFGLNLTGPYFRDDQKPMFDTFIQDLGVTMFRVLPYFVYSDWEVENDNDDPNVMNWEYYNDRYSSPVFEAAWKGLRFLNARGIKPVLALMGPVPEWMAGKTWIPPKHRVCQPDSKMPALDPAMYEEFAEMVVSMAVYARRKAGIDFEYFSPFNETDCYPAEGPRIDPEEVPKVLSAVARRLQKEGLGDVRLTPADHAIIATDYISPILRDDQLMKHVGAFALHSYSDASVGPHVQRVTAGKYAQTPVWLTEYGDLNDRDRSSDNEWKRYSLAANRRALLALNQGANALFFFNAFDDYEECARRLTYYGLFRSADHIYSPKKRYYATRQLYRFVKPGARRIAAGSDSSSLTVAAFHNGAEKGLTIVGVKDGGPANVEIRLPDGGRQVRSWALYLTTRLLDCAKVDDVASVNGLATLTLPEEAIFTLVGDVK